MKPFLRLLALSLSVVFAITAFAQEGESPVPALPADIPKAATIWMLLTDKKPAGQDAMWTTPDGVVHEFFQFNDRGRGPKTHSTYRLDSKGVLTFEETTGVDYMKNPVNESFNVAGGNAKWKNSSEDGQQPTAGGRFYAGLSGGPASGYLLAQALLKNAGKLSLLPGGEATLKELKTVPVEANGKKVNATLYQIDGLDFSPTYLWLDGDHNAFAAVQGWSGLIRRGYEDTFGTLLKAQDEVESARAASLAKQFIHHPSGDLVVKNVTVFDSTTAKAVPAQRVTVHGERIVSVAPERGQPTLSSTSLPESRPFAIWPIPLKISPSCASTSKRANRSVPAWCWQDSSMVPAPTKAQSRSWLRLPKRPASASTTTPISAMCKSRFTAP